MIDSEIGFGGMDLSGAPELAGVRKIRRHGTFDSERFPSLLDAHAHSVRHAVCPTVSLLLSKLCLYILIPAGHTGGLHEHRAL